MCKYYYVTSLKICPCGSSLLLIASTNDVLATVYLLVTYSVCVCVCMCVCVCVCVCVWCVCMCVCVCVCVCGVCVCVCGVCVWGSLCYYSEHHVSSLGQQGLRPVWHRHTAYIVTHTNSSVYNVIYSCARLQSTPRSACHGTWDDALVSIYSCGEFSSSES